MSVPSIPDRAAYLVERLRRIEAIADEMRGMDDRAPWTRYSLAGGTLANGVHESLRQAADMAERLITLAEHEHARLLAAKDAR